MNFLPNGTNGLASYSKQIILTDITDIEGIKEAVANKTNEDFDDDVAFNTRNSFELAALSTGDFYNTSLPDEKWRYVDWAFTRQNDYNQSIFASPFLGYLRNSGTNLWDENINDITGLNRCVFIQTGRIISTINEYTFAAIEIESKRLFTSSANHRDIVRRCGYMINAAINNENQTTINSYYANDFTINHTPFYFNESLLSPPNNQS